MKPRHDRGYFCVQGYRRNPFGKVMFHRTKAPDKDELCRLVNTIGHRVAAYLERHGLLERDEENSYLQLDGLDEDPMQQLLGHSITYRVAVGAQSRHSTNLARRQSSANSGHCARLNPLE